MPTFATLVWECSPGDDHEETHLVVLSAIAQAAVTTLDTPLGESSAPDTSMAVFRYTTGAQLEKVVANLKTLAISFVLTTSDVGNAKACSSEMPPGWQVFDLATRSWNAAARGSEEFKAVRRAATAYCNAARRG